MLIFSQAKLPPNVTSINPELLSVYGNLFIILDHFSRISQLQPTPHVPCATLYLVRMLIGWMAHPMTHLMRMPTGC